MKSTGPDFGFWLLLGLSFGHVTVGETIAATICLVGAIIINAIKSLEKRIDRPEVE